MSNDEIVAYHADVSERAAGLSWALRQAGVMSDPGPVLIVATIALAASYPGLWIKGYSLQKFSEDLTDYIFGEDKPAYARNLFEGYPS